DTAGPSPLVQYSVATLRAGDDTPLTEILAGRDFDVQILVQDLRDDSNPNRGVFAGYTDLLYDKSLAKIRVPEAQTLTFSGPTTGSFTLTLNSGQTTASINHNLQTSGTRAAIPGLVQTALNNL